MTKRNYTDKYKQVIKEVFKRDGFKCVLCGSRKRLQAHHILRYADSFGGQLDKANLVSLCRVCHTKVTGNEYKYVGILREKMGKTKRTRTLEQILEDYEE